MVLSSYKVNGLNSLVQLQPGDILPATNKFAFPQRIVGIPILDQVKLDVTPIATALVDAHESVPGTNLNALGILENDKLEDSQKFPIIKKSGVQAEALAVCEMISLFYKIPFRKDILEKVLDDQFRRDKALSLQLLGRLCEILGMSSQLATVNSSYIDSIETPAIVFVEGIPCVLYKVSSNHATYCNPTVGLVVDDLNTFKNYFVDQCSFLLARRVGTSPTTRFGWNWFTPLIGKYKTPLILVFVSSLLAQLFGLAIPLLIQQIIDKVLNQGNLSSLNVLGTAMIILALFQGLLMALRTYIFVDTTDRMDLTLGSSVIDRLLALPLSFFEKRPVGELSQRMGELNTIRGFLTGTALVSVLNIIFAALYLVVMVIYSPLLSVVHSHIPLYILLVFGVAQSIKLLLETVVAQAKTQTI